jgi:predicted transcriptional regulator
MKEAYYNTNKETGKTLFESNSKALSQEEEILNIFLEHKQLSASRVWNIYNKNGLTPITSVRRGITNLCYRGLIEKTDSKTVGIYGKNEHIYKLLGSSNTEVQTKLFNI